MDAIKELPNCALRIKTGDKFNLLTVVREVEKFIQPSGQTQRGFLCLCDCGKEKTVRLSHLRTGRMASCGHLGGERHGMAYSNLYYVWRGIIDRCTRPGHVGSDKYSERGIFVCDSWRNSFTAFSDWAILNGWRKRLTIDRRDNDGGYSPENCRIVTQFINNCNRRNSVYVVHKGKKKSLALLIFEMGQSKNRKSITDRVRRGWEPMKAIKTPIRQGAYRKGKREKLEAIIQQQGIK